MALPSARRPVCVEEERLQEIEVASKKILKFKWNKTKVFLDGMGGWYKDLSAKEKNKFTPKKLKRRAVYYLATLKMDYEKLPLDWVETLQKEYGVRLRNKKARKEVKSFDAERVVVTVDPLLIPQGARNKELKRFDAERVVVTVDPLQIEMDKGARNEEVKKFVDLSNEPPPPEWLKAYEKGIHLPRELTTYSGPDTNVLFYDYEPNLKAIDGTDLSKWKGKVHDRNGFDWFRNDEDCMNTSTDSNE